MEAASAAYWAVVTKAYSVVAEANVVVVTEAGSAVVTEGRTEGDSEEDPLLVAGVDSKVCSEVASGVVTDAGVVVVTEDDVACPVEVVVGTTPE
jgi:hypothetical protein